MTSLTSLLLFIILSLSIITRAQERAPHGLAYESPMAISPEAYDFFHPDTQPQLAYESPMAFSPEAYDFFHPDTQSQRGNGPCSSSDCSTLPEAATVLSTPAHKITSTPDAGGKRLGASSIASISIGLVSALLVGVGVYYVVITRRNNAARAKAARQLQPDV